MKMKLIMAMLFATLFATGANAQSKTGKKMLVVYYSWSGNTRTLANHIKAATGADVLEIMPAKAYPTDYQACVDQAKKEILAGYKPTLKTKVPNLTAYDIIFVGSPNWWSNIAPPISTFLSTQNLAGKTVVPFVTHGGGGMASCEANVKKLCPKSVVLKGLAVSGGSAASAQSSVKKWLQQIGLQK